MNVIKYLIGTITDILNMNFNLFGYKISLMSVILFVTLGGILMKFLYSFFLD